MSLDNLERRITEKVNKVEDVAGETNKTDTYDRATEKILAQGNAIYRLVDNTTRRIERSLRYIEQKQNLIIKAMEDSGVDLEDIQKQEEILKLEQKLKELKGV